MRRVELAVAVSAVVLFTGCATRSQNGITQVATIDALLAGVYDGHMTLDALRGYGDFGIGTFEGLDGEMILLDGNFYKVRADGKVYQPPMTERTPFACVTEFDPDHAETIPDAMDLNEFKVKIDTLVPETNRFCAFILKGCFSHVLVRSVPAQQKPYPPLAEVTKTQPVFTLSMVYGTLIGFRAPAFVKGVNVPGYHMHFLADDLSGGGHVLEFDLMQGTLEADTVHQWLNVYLPSGSASFESADMTKDRSKELLRVEQ